MELGPRGCTRMHVGASGNWCTWGNSGRHMGSTGAHAQSTGVHGKALGCMGEHMGEYCSAREVCWGTWGCTGVHGGVLGT